MALFTEKEQEKSCTVLGENTFFQGVLKFSDELDIAGKFEGVINATGALHIRKTVPASKTAGDTARNNTPHKAPHIRERVLPVSGSSGISATSHVSVNGSAMATTRPAGSTAAVCPVAVERTSGTPFSTARNTDIARCWYWQQMSFAQASFVKLTIARAPALTKRRDR